MDLVIYVHGKGGTAAESRHYEPLFPGTDVVGLDYRSDTPGEAGREIRLAVEKQKTGYENVTLIANSIGAFFCMAGHVDELIKRAYFISPIVDMEKLIRDMMQGEGVTEKELQTKGAIRTSYGEELSWDYLRYVREHPVRWDAPTRILYGRCDGLTSWETISAFAAEHKAELTVMENGEHWFHTAEQMRFLDEWIREKESGVVFKNFERDDYKAVCDFLIALNQQDRSHINWNWARFEWMYEHPEFDKSALSSIGLWMKAGNVAGAAIYDMYFGEAFCAALPEYGFLYPEILGYAFRELRDEAGLGIALCGGNEKEIRSAEAEGFAPADQTETVMKISLDRPLPVVLPEGYSILEIDPERDGYRQLQWLFWRGFDHGEDQAEFEKDFEKTERAGWKKRVHFKSRLSVSAAGPDGDYAAYCCVWYDERTDYAYVEPVCTVPACRGKGIGRAVVSEALNRAGELGAKTAYVISDLPFYQKIGFVKDRGYRFYWKK